MGNLGRFIYIERPIGSEITKSREAKALVLCAAKKSAKLIASFSTVPEAR
ncbi:hypothetical protein LEP1GSC188_0902 [Leptospira weilii serovar Topaz str. LT2116]|uniref:Uncharacterized protein n=1 Tax=Leptospira weilii serovar Topaz str. LT2116 TaxID=1088540 RepID=M3FNL8_9LEPT|nr:hypothetical protein LEP1GSC188_0902 [Leptospira weilii serovar Topaz str. LT2116]